jgi:arylformamidase
MRIHDITQPLGDDTAVWPGDHQVGVSWTMRRDQGDSVNVALLQTTVHAGTHADGWLHVSDDGAAAAEMPIDAYIGRCVVVDAGNADVISSDVVAGIDLARAQRVLFRTRSVIDATTFPARFAPIATDLAQKLADAGVRLVGTDAPSVDDVDSKSLDTHNVFVKGRVAILENLVLTDIAPGEYTLIALPLKLTHADSSPVRAILVEGAIE